MGLLPDGRIDGEQHQAAMRSILDDGWPDRTTLICAVRQHDLRRVTFGREIKPSMSDAIAASCAVPGYFRPVEIDGTSYVDGGIHSPTNATALSGGELDLAIICSPMSTRDPKPLGPVAWARRYASSKLRREVAELERREIPTVVLEPGSELHDLMGFDFMAHANTRAIIGASMLDAGEQLRRPRVRTLMEGLAAPAARSDPRLDRAP